MQHQFDDDRPTHGVRYDLITGPCCHAVAMVEDMAVAVTEAVAVATGDAGVFATSSRICYGDPQHLKIGTTGKSLQGVYQKHCNSVGMVPLQDPDVLAIRSCIWLHRRPNAERMGSPTQLELEIL